MNTYTRAMLPLAALAAALATACGASSPMSHHTAHASQAAAQASPSCQSQVQTWSSGGGTAELHAVAHDTEKLSKDTAPAVAGLQSGDTSGFTTLGSDGSQLSADAQAALNDPPPACRSSGNRWFRQAMSEYATAGQDMVTGASQVQGGNYSGADTAIKACNTALILQL